MDEDQSDSGAGATSPSPSWSVPPACADLSQAGRAEYDAKMRGWSVVAAMGSGFTAADAHSSLPAPDRQVGPEVSKTIRQRIESGFFSRYLSGSHVLDIGYRGNRPTNLPIVPQAIGIERDYPGYDGKTLPFEDGSQDAVHSSHCLEHIPDSRAALAEWFRVLKIGGYLVLTVPHQQLYERKPIPTSRWGGNEHRRFYTPASFLAELESALPVGEFRVRSLRDNDADFDYAIPPEMPPRGCYEIEVVIERISRPPYADSLRLSSEARAMIEKYRQKVETLLLLDADGHGPSKESLIEHGKSFPIPPYSALRPFFPDVPEDQMRGLLWPLVDPGVVDAEWYVKKHPDVLARIDGDLARAGEHYQRAGYFERKLPNLRVGLYG